MKEVRWCRCGSSLFGEHERTEHCVEGKPRIPLPVDAPPERTATLVAAAMVKEQAAGVVIFERPAVNGGQES